MRLAELWLAIVVAIAGCGKQVNAEYCAQALHHGEAFCRENFPDAGVDAAIQCTVPMDPMCRLPTPLCKLGTGTGVCVQCIAGMDESQCGGDRPVCEPTINACRGCLVDSECIASQLCLPTGACADVSDVALAVPDGTGTMAAGCNPTACTLTNALKSSKKYIKASGAFSETINLDNVGPKTIYGVPGMTSLTRAMNGPIIEAKGNAIVDLWDLEIIAGPGMPNDGALQLTSGTPAIGAHRLSIHGASKATPSMMIGVLVSAGSLVLERSTVANFASGGIDIAGATTFDLEANFIGHNGVAGTGNNGSAIGGVLLEVAPAGSHLAWNTLAFNGSSANNSNAAGIDCAAQGTDGAGNLLFHNTRGNSANTQTNQCGFTNILEIASDSGNLGFKSPDVSDFHLQATGSEQVIDKAGKPCPAFDIDGESRPYPAAGTCDYGADEFR